MKRFLLILALTGLFACPLFAETSVQSDQNAGFLKMATATFTISGSAVTDLLTTVPSSGTAWVAAHPGGQWVILPSRCKGFVINAFDGDMIIGDPDNIATGALYVGAKIASGTAFKWEALNPDQRTIRFRLYMNDVATGRATFCAWGQ